MRLTSILFFLLFLITSNAWSQNISNVFLSGTISNVNNQDEVEDMSELKDMRLQDYSKIIIPDSVGFFKIHFHLDKSNYFRIGRNIVFLSPGDTIEMHLDLNKPQIARFIGKQESCKKNELLKNTLFPKGGSFLDGGSKIQNTIQSTIDTILSLSTKRLTQLQNFNITDSKFVEWESVRIKADILNSLFSISFQYPYIKHIKDDSLKSFYKMWQATIDPYVNNITKDFWNSKYLNLEVYRNVVAKQYPFTCLNRNDKMVFDSWILAKKCTNRLMYLSDKNSIRLVKDSIDKIEYISYRNLVTEFFNKKLQFNDGDKAIDFTMINDNNKKIKLSKFKGKIIFIDIWATWCGPCLRELHYVDSLKSLFKDSDKVTFLTLSIDDETLKWKSFLKQHTMQENQFNIDRQLLKEYEIFDIPRTIIIDKNFNIVKLNGELPSKSADFLRKLIFQ